MSLPYLAIDGALSHEDQSALNDLYRRGTPPNTLRAYERDLVYLTAWKTARIGSALAWPESEAVALTFVLDHARDLQGEDGPAAETARFLVKQGLKRDLSAPSVATLNRRIASWRAFHRMKSLHSPFEAPALRAAVAKARKAGARAPRSKSPNPITRDVLKDLLAMPDAEPDPGLRGLRDRAMLLLAWASGGRRRSEVTALHRADIDISELDELGRIWLNLGATKTTQAGTTPRLILKGRAARVLMGWITAAEITEGPLFRAISKSGRVLDRGLAPDALRGILRRRLAAAGYPADFATPHGLRSGFLTQAALDGAPLQAAMRLSLHRSAAQAQAYYDDVDLAENPATDLLEDDLG